MKHFVSQIKLRVFFPQLDLTCVKLMNVTVFRANSGSSMKRQQSVGFDSHLRSLTHHSDGEITLQTLSHMYRFVLIYIYTKKKNFFLFTLSAETLFNRPVNITRGYHGSHIMSDNGSALFQAGYARD